MSDILKTLIISSLILTSVSCLKELEDPVLDKDSIDNIFDPTYKNYDVWLKQVSVDSTPNPNFPVHIKLKFKYEIINEQLKNHFGDYYVEYSREGKTFPSPATIFQENGRHYFYMEMFNFNSSTGDFCFTTYIINNDFKAWKSGKLEFCYEF